MVPQHRQGHGITYENYDRIQDGMTLENVTQGLGDPPGFYITMPFKAEGRFFNYPPDIPVDDSAEKTWASDEACIEVSFTKDGKVHSKSWRMSDFALDQEIKEALAPSPWKRLKRFFRL
jgi:hypothetical protein